ncbi:hypothetical protein Glove_186g183 [Diversispora epigaea]|uniref:Uncharacterized protein n=1 Tax=Diversispora epigaea TaxID=1348612 RepID=A0A397IWI6_9GLOM|nr:hypothetical protein Glove_186g183 [Diversispora epigaea]
MLGRQKDIMMGYHLCWNGRKILWRVYLVYVGMAERYYDGFIGLSFMLEWQKDIMAGLFGLCWDGRKILWWIYFGYRFSKNNKKKCEELQVIEDPEKVEYSPNEFI